jgi:poly(3-hydroxybutyrate) depolymerase
MVVFHGSADATVHPDNAARIVAGHGGDTASGTRDTVPASNGTRGYSRTVVRRGDGSHDLECWIVEGAAHAWSGGQPGGSYTDPTGPDASAAMVGFFLYGASDRDGPGDTSPC